LGLDPQVGRTTAILGSDVDHQPILSIVSHRIVAMTGIVIPTLGGRHLPHCLDAVAALDPPAGPTVVVASGGAAPTVSPQAGEVVAIDRRLGFAAAANVGIDRLGDDCDRIALLNDDAVPAPGWLAPLEAALDDDPRRAAVQGTVTDAVGAAVDGRGIALDAVGLPVQIDRGGSPAPEANEPRALLAVSGTAALFRTDALQEAALADGSIFDPGFGSYHEDLDLGLRLKRLGWEAAWVPGAWAGHVGSASGRRLGWRHPWWVLTNRWRAIAGNLTPAAVLAALPTLLRGELRAIRTLAGRNPRAIPVAALALIAVPWLVVFALARPSPGPRLIALPEVRT
jgi:GT2 family glycosyltransferase